TARISTHYMGGLFGSLASVIRLQQAARDEAAAAFSYAVQHAGGSTTWLRDVDHIEKSVVFGGLPARSAGFFAPLARLGFTGGAQSLHRRAQFLLGLQQRQRA